MKRLSSTLLLILMLPSLVWGQVTTTNNDSLDASFSNPTNLTDKEAESAKDFVHSGIKNRAMEEGCAKLNNCSAEDDGMPLEDIIGKLYSVIFGGMLGMMSGGGPTLKKKAEVPATDTPPTEGTGTTPAEGQTANAAEKKDETQADYCMYAAMAYETIGAILQSNLQKKANNSAEAAGDVQLQSLISLKEAHKARRKTASYQAAVYGAISACYGVMAFQKSLDLSDWKFWAKMGGAIALTGLYVKKMNKHDKAVKKVQAVIDSLPKAGDCNPWTGTACFCKEATSKNSYPGEYQEVCVLNNGNPETPKVALGCAAVTNNKLAYDKECNCKKNNTCYKATLGAVMPKIGLGTNFMNSANQGFDLLNSGEFDEGKLAEYATGAAAMASGLKPKTAVKMPNIPLNTDQQKLADELKPSLGSLAALAAVSPQAGPTSGYKDTALSSAAIDKLTPEVKEKLAEAIKGNYRSRGGYNAVKASDEPTFSFPTFGAQAAKKDSTEVLTFAEQAIMNADVSKTPETPIFDIISNRYRRSAWERLQPVEKK